MIFAPLSGQTLGNYRVLDKLGHGGMGVVYLGEHIVIGRKVAIKVLRPGLTGNPSRISRFFNEARAAAQIRHAGIVDILDFGTHEDGTSYLVMEYLEGENLHDRLERVVSLPEETVRRLGRQIASALAAAHAHQIVHRDLKPDNLFLVSDGDVVGGERIKVLDFGVAKLLAEPIDGAVVTRSGAILGSPGYMAPEQARGQSSVDERTDVYALGCVLFEMACGRPPFFAVTFAEALALHLLMPAPSPREHVPTISAHLDALIYQMLSKEPAGRPASMDEVAAELSRGIDLAARAPIVVDAERARTPPTRESRARKATPKAGATLTMPPSAAAPAGGPADTDLPGAGRSPRRYALISVAALVIALATAVAVALQWRPAAEPPVSSSTSAPQPAPPRPNERTRPSNSAAITPSVEAKNISPPDATSSSRADVAAAAPPAAARAAKPKPARAERKPKPKLERGQLIDDE